MYFWIKIYIFLILIFFCIFLFKRTNITNEHKTVIETCIDDMYNILYDKRRPSMATEPFTQLNAAPTPAPAPRTLTNYIFKENENKYDGYYAEIYNIIHKPENSYHHLETVIQQTQADHQRSIFLDIDCKTGRFVNYLQERGFENTHGVDESQAMVEYCENIDPTITVKQANIADAIIYEPDLFTHIYAINSLFIYRQKNKQKIIENIYGWLINGGGGYFVLHLIDTDEHPTAITATVAATATATAAGKCYKSMFSFFNNENQKIKEYVVTTQPETIQSNNISAYLTLIEKIKDDADVTHEYHETLYIENIKTIIKYATDVGFSLVGKIDNTECSLGHYLYIFQKN